MTLTSAIVLHVSPSFEHDLLVELLTKDHGRIRCFAKYAQTKKPRFGGQLNTLNLIKVNVNERGKWFYIGSVSVLDGFSQIKQSYQKIQLAYQFLTITRAMTQINAVNEEAFGVLQAHLSAMNQHDQLEIRDHKLSFLQMMLKIEGVLSNEKKPSETECLKMIESYTNITLKDDL